MYLFCSRLLQRNSLPPARSFPSSPKTTCQPLCGCLPPLKSHPVYRRNFQVNFTPSHPADAFGLRPSPRTSHESIRFYPPHPHGLSQAESSTLLRVHLPPRTLHPAPRTSSWHQTIPLARKPYGASPVNTPIPVDDSILTHM
jgi:hypothetical protein